jgi:sugar lactone lactonase YvrE
MSRTRDLTTLALLASAILLPAAASAKADPAVEKAARKLGADKIQAIEFEGAGAWYQFGQAPAPGLAWPKWTLTNYKASIDYAAPAARVQLARLQVVEPNRARPAPSEQKGDSFVAGDVSWNQPATGAATAAPASLEERRAEIWSTPQGLLRAKRNGKLTTVEFTAGGKYRYEGDLNSAGEVVAVRTWIDNPVLGDTLLESKYSDYQSFGEAAAKLSFPRRIERALGGFPWLEVDVSAARIAQTGGIAQPANLTPAAAVEVKASLLDKGVWYLTGGSHHSLLVEQDDHLIVIEAPQHEARSLAVIAKAKELAPGKPIKYIVNSHAHFDHSGGLRTFVDEGAIVVTDAGNVAFYEKAWAQPHAINPDRLAKSGKTPRFEAVKGKLVLAGRQPVEIHQIAGSGHNDAFSLIYLPTGKILVEADAFTPGAVGAAPSAQPNPFTVNLADNLKRLGLEVWQIAALHGPRVASYDDLALAAGLRKPPAPTTAAVVKADVPGVVKSGTAIELVGQAFDGTEGPLGLADGSFVFTENRVDRVRRIGDDGKTSVFLERTGNPNALASGPDGTIFAAQTQRPGIGIVYPAEKARVLVDNFEGKPLNRPNDLIVDRGGGVWFTDPGAGPAQRQPGVAAPAAAPIPAVYHYSPSGQLRQITTDIARPNGISLSPDEKTLYVANTYGEHVVAYDIARENKLGKPRNFAKLAGFKQTDNGPSSGADGLAVDAEGRLYVASSAGVEVFDDEGKALGVIELPNAPQNIAFAGTDRSTLYVVGRGAVWKIQTLAKGPQGRAK